MVWQDKAFWYCISLLFFCVMIKFFSKKNKTVIIFIICYITLGGFLAGAYVYTHTPINGIVPPIIYIRLIDSEGNPVQNASCSAYIADEEGETEKSLTPIGTMRILECFGRTECPKAEYRGYYRLDVTNYSYETVFWIFKKPIGIIKGDFNINIVCRTADSVAYYEMNKTNFPCSPLPLLGNYLTPSFYCSSDKKILGETIYNFDNNTFDDYDAKAINFIDKNYKNKTVLSNDKLAIVIYSFKINNPVGIIPDKKSYGAPYEFNDFMASNCEYRKEIVDSHNIDLILSRFKFSYECDFMKEIYNDTDYIYEIIK